MSKYKKMTHELVTFIQLRLKIIFHDKLNVVLMMITLGVFAVLLGTLSSSARDKSRIPVGVVDYDTSISSTRVLNLLENNKSLYLYQDTFNNLEKMLEEEQLDAIFVIEKGFENKIKEAKANKLISVYYLEGKEESKILSDIVAADFVDEVTLWRSIHKYVSYQTKNFQSASKEYLDYIEKRNEDREYNFQFDVEYRTDSGEHGRDQSQSVGTSEQGINNEIIYYKVVMIILTLFLSFLQLYFMTSILHEKEKGILKRLRVLPSNDVTMICGNFLAIGILNVCLSVLFTTILTIHFASFSLLAIFQFCLGILLYTLVMESLFLLMSQWFHSGISIQLAGTIIIFILGTLGALPIFGGILPTKLLNISKFIPNYLFIQEFTDIIIYGNLSIKGFICNLKLLFIIILLIILFILPHTSVVYKIRRFIKKSS